MAEERQKRILIKEYDLACDLADCKYCEEQNWCSEKDGMTRQEAIEKMAKAICKSDGICTATSCGNCTEWLGNDSEAAEAALNALLDTDTPKDNKN